MGLEKVILYIAYYKLVCYNKINLNKGAGMYKIDIAKGFTKYFLTYSEAMQYAKSCGIRKSKIKSVN